MTLLIYSWNHFISNEIMLFYCECHKISQHCFTERLGAWSQWWYYAKLSRAMWAPWMDRFGNNEIYFYPLSKKRCGPPLRSPRITWLEGIVPSGRQQRNETILNKILDAIYIMIIASHGLTRPWWVNSSKPGKRWEWQLRMVTLTHWGRDKMAAFSRRLF